MTEEPVVTMQDIREIKLCAAGARAFARAQGFDWSKFLVEGLPATVLEATGNHFAVRAAENARKRWAEAKHRP